MMKRRFNQSLRLLSLAALAAGGLRAQPQAFNPLDLSEQVNPHISDPFCYGAR
jgi:hypothetical protein